MAAYATRYMRTPTWVRLIAIDPSLRGIRQYYKITTHSDLLPNSNFEYKVEPLINFLSSISFVQAIVFTNYQIKYNNQVTYFTLLSLDKTKIYSQ
jgi:hypothetical protein